MKSKMADETNVWQESNLQSSVGNSAGTAKVRPQSAVDAKRITPFLYNGRFSVLTVLCSSPLLYFGGERLFGIATVCMLAVYVLHITFHHTKSSVIGYIISMVIMQFCILYSIGPVLWHSFFNLILLFLYNVFIVLTGGLGLIQFETFRKEEMEFCANVEYFLFLLYPPTCVLILVWIFSLIFGVHFAPYLFIIIGFPVCHTFLDPRIKCSFSQNDYVLGQPETILAMLNFIFSPSFAYFLVNVSHLLHYSSWIEMCFCVGVPFFLITFLDTTDIRDLADIRNSQWQLFQVVSGCFSLILGNILIYVHDMVDGLHAVFLAVILICSTAVFVAVKYRYSQMVSFMACGLLFTSYLGWYSLLPWNSMLPMRSFVKLSFFTIELLIALLGFLSVLAVFVSISVRHRQFLNQVLVLHTLEVLVESSSYPVLIMIATIILMLYMVQRLYHVGRLTKNSSLICISLHGAKLVAVATTTGINQTASSLSFVASILGGLLFSYTVTNIMFFEHKKKIDRQKALRYVGCLLVSLTVLFPNFLRWLWIIITFNEPSIADTIGLILALTGMFIAKVTFFHMDDRLSRKQCLVLLVFGVLLIVIQPYFNVFEITSHVPKVIFREIFYETWEVVLAEYMILPWCLLFSLTIILVLMLKLLPLKELSSLSMNIISCLIGAPLGWYFAYLVLPYPKVSSSFLSIPYMLSASIATNSILSAFKDRFPRTTPVMYLVFLFVSFLSVAVEITMNVNIMILQAPTPPSILFQGIFHLIKIIQLRQECFSQASLDMKKSTFPSMACNISVIVVFLFGLLCAPKDYYDILVVPLCGCLLLLKTNGLNLVNKSKGEFVFNMITFTVVFGLIMYYRLLLQLPLTKMSFWIVVASILELAVVLLSSSVFVIIVLIFWKQKMSEMEERGLAFLAPIFTFLLFYGRTSAGQVLGVVGPVLAYCTFNYTFR